MPIAVTAGVVLIFVLISVIYRVVKEKVVKPRRKDSLDSMYNVKAYVNQCFPEEDLDRSRDISAIDDDAIGFDNIRGRA